MAVAAELPDIDTLWSLRGSVTGFEHHRGITHTFLGVPFEAAAVVALFFLVHRLWARGGESALARGVASENPKLAAPVRWGNLYGCVLLALLSHLLLDYTNNYGIRPFFPFNPHWYAASIVFIFDPLVFVLLLAGLLLPSLFALVAREVGSRENGWRGAGWARAALLALVSLWSFRWYEHSKAVAQAAAQVMRAPVTEAELRSTATDPANAAGQATTPARRPMLTARRVLASPDPLSPFRWYTAADYGPAYLLGTADTNAGTLSIGHVLHKAPLSPLSQAAERSHLGRIYLDWSSMPWITSGAPLERGLAGSSATIIFQDLRFMGGPSFLLRNGLAPLTGEVVLSPRGEILDESMDGRSEH